uniref:Si:dkey-256h2.1 n=1 Tax=Cyclopterus lumpus TaxID=8103 RepID=A0A8C2WH22_CYCLU
MVLLCPKPSVLWLLAVVVTARVGKAAGKPKLIDYGAAACDSRDNGVSLRPSAAASPDGPEPGDPAAAFSVPTLDGEFSYQPGALRGPLVVHAFSNKSGFLECMWSSESSLVSLVEELPDSTQVLFLSLDDSALSDALWMRDQLQRVAMHRNKEVLSRLHFSPVPVFALGNWIPNVLYYWRCTGRGCVFSQVVFKSEGWNMPIIVKRLDARYDWLMTRGDPKSYRLMEAGDGCEPSPSVAGALAWVSEGNCSFFTKVQSMAKSNASGVLVYALPGNPIQDMNCVGDECDATLAIPAAMVHLEVSVARALEIGQPVYASFQNTPGALAEMGWFIYPSFSFLNWQAQWFDFYAALQTKLQSPAEVISVFDKVQMHGEDGAVATVELPIALSDFDALHLDASLSCPGARDSSCAHWDHAVRLLVCCDPGGPSCGTELGRWVTAFRRGIGRWLTDVTPLIPLLDSNRCTLTMKTVPWAMPWVVSLNLRFSVNNRTDYDVKKLRPFRVTPLYSGGTFDKNYNKRYRPTEVSVPASTRKVELYAVVTAHGYDDNGCGEFCVTSHHFLINDVFNNTLTFDSAGTPLGCTLRVKEGAVPNEHGTWLYGRGGWCDGFQVDPWRTDVTKQLNASESEPNTVVYFGLFQGKDPNPSKEPGYIIMSSFLVFYK